MRHTRRITTQAPSTSAITTPLAAIITATMPSVAPTTIATTAAVQPVANTVMPAVPAVGTDPPTTWGVIHQIALEMLAMC